MPAWKTELPVQKKHMGFDLVRTPQSVPLQAIVTCEKLLVCDTHYYGGRTVPCEREAFDDDGKLIANTCHACNEAVPFRTHVYVSAFDVKTRDHFIFECTSHAAKPLEEYFKANGTLRGCIIHASRPRGLKNSKVVLQTNTVNQARCPLPEAPNLILALSTIWRLPGFGMTVRKQRFEQDQIKPKKSSLRRMREQPDNAGGAKGPCQILEGNGRTLASI